MRKYLTYKHIQSRIRNYVQVLGTGKTGTFNFRAAEPTDMPDFVHKISFEHLALWLSIPF